VEVYLKFFRHMGY